jgi:hypothetical protein
MGTFVFDIVEPIYYHDKKIPESDRAVWTIEIDNRAPITVHVGAGNDAQIDNSAIRVQSVSGTYHNVRCITAVEVPASALGKAQFNAGDVVQLKSRFVTHARAERIDWMGSFKFD